MKKRLWASKDRYTDWGRKYEMTHPDGTVETQTVECTKVAHPRKQQVMMTDVGTRVIDRDRRLLNAKTGQPIKPRTKYYSFSQSFHSGPNTNGDALGGFNTGRFVEISNERTFKKAIAEMESAGFTLKETY